MSLRPVFWLTLDVYELLLWLRRRRGDADVDLLRRWEQGTVLVGVLVGVDGLRGRVGD